MFFSYLRHTNKSIKESLSRLIFVTQKAVNQSLNDIVILHKLKHI